MLRANASWREEREFEDMLMDRRLLYAIVNPQTHELLASIASVGGPGGELIKKHKAETPSSVVYNITHGGTPNWVRELAVKANAQTSPDAEVYLGEKVVRVSSSYTLSEKASALMQEDFHWIPDLAELLTVVPGFSWVTVDRSDQKQVVITVDMDVAEGGGRDDPARRAAFKAIDGLLLDISRFGWHLPSDMKDDPCVSPILTATGYVFTSNERDGAVLLNWADDGRHSSLVVRDAKILSKLRKQATPRDLDVIQNFAEQQIAAFERADAISP